MFDDGVEKPSDSAVPNLRKPESGASPGSGNQPELIVRQEVEFKPAWVYITYTTKIEHEKTGKY